MPPTHHASIVAPPPPRVPHACDNTHGPAPRNGTEVQIRHQVREALVVTACVGLLTSSRHRHAVFAPLRKVTSGVPSDRTCHAQRLGARGQEMPARLAATMGGRRSRSTYQVERCAGRLRRYVDAPSSAYSRIEHVRVQCENVALSRSRSLHAPQHFKQLLQRPLPPVGLFGLRQAPLHSRAGPTRPCGRSQDQPLETVPQIRRKVGRAHATVGSQHLLAQRIPLCERHVRRAKMGQVWTPRAPARCTTGGCGQMLGLGGAACVMWARARVRVPDQPWRTRVKSSRRLSHIKSTLQPLPQLWLMEMVSSCLARAPRAPPPARCAPVAG